MKTTVSALKYSAPHNPPPLLFVLQPAQASAQAVPDDQIMVDSLLGQAAAGEDQDREWDKVRYGDRKKFVCRYVAVPVVKFNN
jgi:hypothetical protein